VRIAAPLRAQVVAAIEVDDLASPAANRARHNIGLQHEFVLIAELRNRSLQFLTESQLRCARAALPSHHLVTQRACAARARARRERGAVKTPDVLFTAPVMFMVRGRPRPVFWVDSKATFGDDGVHEAASEQYGAYVGRYGPGMVVYWFGHVEAVEHDRDVAVVTRLPDAFLPAGCTSWQGAPRAGPPMPHAPDGRVLVT
jgi:hypothetical protein